MYSVRSSKARWLHNAFEAGIILKGIDGLLEILGGAILLEISPAQINRILPVLLRHELSEDPRDLVANFLLRAAGHLSMGTQLFGSIYLLSHGIIKVVIILSLLRNRLWAYPVSIAFFGVFIAYQLYRYTYSHSFWLIVLSVFDLLVIGLTCTEFSRVKTTGYRR